MQRYVVVENTPGYLPDDDEPLECDSFAEACEYVRDDVTAAAHEAGYTLMTHAPDWSCAKFARLDSPHDLGRVVEVLPLGDAD